MNEKIDEVLEIIVTIACTFIVIAIIIFIIEFKEMLNDHRCYNLPLNEFFKDKRCERYWDMKKWSEK
nr:MAG TPA: hypothetical protein [Caudoviricetes sp.]